VKPLIRINDLPDCLINLLDSVFLHLINSLDVCSKTKRARDSVLLNLLEQNRWVSSFKTEKQLCIIRGRI